MSHFYICIIYLIKLNETSQFTWLGINWNMSLDTSLLKSAAESKLIQCMGSMSMLLMFCLHTCLHTHSRPWNWSLQMPTMYFDIQGKCPCNQSYEILENSSAKDKTLSRTHYSSEKLVSFNKLKSFPLCCLGMRTLSARKTLICNL